MSKRHTPVPEGYYDEEELDDEGASTRARLHQRLAAIFGTSYGISVAVHLAILLILATIIISTPPPPSQNVPLSVHRLPPERPEKDRTPDVKDREPVPLPEQVEVPLVSHEEIPNPTPLGKPDNVGAVEQDKKSFVDPVGIGGGGAGAFGSPRGQGPPSGSGGGPDTEDAVLGALKWLMDHQAPDGRWEAAGWSARCKEGGCSGPGWNAGSGAHDVGVTALSLLAYLGNGQTHRYAKPSRFRPVVKDGLRWLRKQQQQDGAVGDAARDEGIYGHAIATMALCEAYALTRDPELKAPALRATEWLVQAQNPGLGWKYGVRPGHNDTSVTGWAVLALKAAKVANLDVPAAAFEGARNWLARATDTAGSTGYESPGGGSSIIRDVADKFDDLPANTSVAVLCRVLMGERRSHDDLRRGLKLILEERPSLKDPRKINYYAWYYGTYAMFQLGGQPWVDWNEAMKETLLPGQRRGGCADGSWDPIDTWSIAGGRVYATAINALTLEIYYRYARAKAQPTSPSGD